MIHYRILLPRVLEERVVADRDSRSSHTARAAHVGCGVAQQGHGKGHTRARTPNMHVCVRTHSGGCGVPVSAGGSAAMCVVCAFLAGGEVALCVLNQSKRAAAVCLRAMCVCCDGQPDCASLRVVAP